MKIIRAGDSIFIKISFFLFFFLLPLFANNANKQIEGIVIDAETGNRLAQANIIISGTDFGTITNNDGEFVIEYSSDYPLSLQISHIGYITYVEQITQQMTNSIEIKLYPQTIQMDELVVTGTRSKKFRSEAPIATEVISQKEIQNSGARNVAELLSQRAGVSLQTSVAGGSILNVLGMDSRYVLILIDGQPLTGKFNDRVSLDQILTAQLAKVEIVKGPSSSLYGSEAMGGVINIITDNNKDYREVNISGRYGNTQNNFEGNGLKNGSNNIGLNIIHPLNNLLFDFSINIEEIQKDKAVLQIDIDKVRKTVFGSKINWELNDNNKVSFRSNSYSQIDNGASQLMNTNTDIDRNNFSFSHQTNYQKSWNLNQTLINNNYSRNYVQKRPWGKLEKDDLTNEKHLEYEILLNKQTESSEVNAGFEIYRANYSSDRINSGEQEITSKSIFGQYDLRINNQLNLIVGSRFDNYSKDYKVLSPRVGLMYKINDKWKVRTSWGKGFRAPSFIERFIDWNNVQFNYLIEGNPDLKPEQSNGVTVGLDYFNSSNSELSLNYYYTFFENRIQDTIKKPGVISYENSSNAKFSGLELTYRFKTSDNLESKWVMNLLNNRDEDDNPIPNTIPFSISNFTNFGLFNNFLQNSINLKWVAPYKPQEFDTQKGIYVLAQEKNKGYTLINFRSTIKIYNSLKVSLVLENVGNYTNENIGPFIGRAAYLELSNTIIKGE